MDICGQDGGRGRGGGSAVVVNLDRVKKCTLKKFKNLGNNQSNPIKYIESSLGTIVAPSGYHCRL